MQAGTRLHQWEWRSAPLQQGEGKDLPDDPCSGGLGSIGGTGWPETHSSLGGLPYLPAERGLPWSCFSLVFQNLLPPLCLGEELPGLGWAAGCCLTAGRALRMLPAVWQLQGAWTRGRHGNELPFIQVPFAF